MLPAWEGIIPALNSLREKNRRGRMGPPEPRHPGAGGPLPASCGSGENASSDRQPLRSGREMAFLGRLIRRWGEIVGPDLQKHVYPTRLMGKKLHLIAADSQWLHTLRFIKPELLAKLGRLFPGVAVTEIMSSIGRIPEDALPKPPRVWPDWEEKRPPALPEEAKVDDELRRTIERCASKLQARQQALETEGFALCPRCRAILIPLTVECCSVCLYRERMAFISGIRSLMTWLTSSPLTKEIPKSRSKRFVTQSVY